VQHERATKFDEGEVLQIMQSREMMPVERATQGA
jgi:hypothetical protein